MRVNLRINFAKLDTLSTKSNEYAQNLEQVKSAVARINQVVENNKGLAADGLKDEPKQINEKVDKIIEGLNSMSDLFNSFCGDMTSIIKPSNEAADMYLPMLTVKSRVKNLQQQLESFASAAAGCSIPKLGVVDISQSAGGNSSDSNNSFDMDKYNDAKAQLARMEEVAKKIIDVAKTLQSEYEQELENIYKKVEDFGNTDSDYENKAESVYESFKNLQWYQTTTAQIIFGVVGVTAAIAVIVVGAPAIAGALVTAGLSATAATVVAGGAVVVAKGALIGAATTGIIDTATAVYKKEDIDSAFGSGLSTGLISGAISSGIANAAPVIVSKGGTAISAGTNYIRTIAPNATNRAVQLVSSASTKVTQAASTASSTAYRYASTIAPNVTDKVANYGGRVIQAGSAYLSNPANIAQEAVEMGGSVIGDGIGAVYAGNDFEISDSIYKAATNKVIDAGKTGVVKEIDKKIEQINVPHGNEAVKKVSKVLNRGAVGIAKDETQNVANDIKESIDKIIETGEGSVGDNYSHDTLFQNNEKLAKSALAGNKKDAKSIVENKAEKVMDYIERSFENRRNRQ